jgi:hypothetical protein
MFSQKVQQLRQLIRNCRTFHPIMELDDRVAPLGITMRKPFDEHVEGQFRKASGGDSTPTEFLIAGVRGWEADVRRRMDDDKSKPD